MKELRPLKDSSRSAASRALLHAARRDALPEGARARAIGALGIGTGVAAAGAATTTAAKASTVLLAKWIAIGAVGAVTAAASVGYVVPYVVHRATAQAASIHEPPIVAAVGAAPPIRTLPAHVAVASVDTIPLPPAPVQAFAPVEPSRPKDPQIAFVRAPPTAATPVKSKPTEDTTLAASSSAPESPPASAASERPDSLSIQLETLSRVRGALSGHDASHALVLLDAFAQRNPSSSLAEEATVLRVEALSGAGRATEARALAESFSARHPASPYLDRVRQAMQSP